jgi:hypothetical protein
LLSPTVSAAVHQDNAVSVSLSPTAEYSKQFRSTFHMMRTIWAQFGLHSGNMNFNTHKE